MIKKKYIYVCVCTRWMHRFMNEYTIFIDNWKIWIQHKWEILISIDMLITDKNREE